jgi:hypothetical protein
MKAVFTVALALGLCGFVSAREEKANPVGTWKCKYEVGGQEMESTLVVKMDGDKLVGTMTYPENKESKLKEPKLKDGELTFATDVEFMDMKFTVKYKLKVDGDKLKGKAAAEINGDVHEVDIDGTRLKKSK